ncbi:lipopolysaccharide core heptose(II) kinase RfaY [Cetobacterium sp. 2G large]|uniref:lipopolysaccharide core heptose(II) kinase RfaY n=1 Tax=Cetobacterium sp. 2G large TaxID=2759680 RepID=UPI00163C1A13|nr:lipopolysaccharide core heptose(II) kinase RfaY [Cetobacterium sp. 2G large]MBC2852547.1 lipopolysaccharide biosynthesis protein [Cetobacterium sp. 2G large]
MIRDVLYKEFKIYYKDEESRRLAEIVLDKNYKVIEEYKNTERNYVAKIEIGGRFYVLKSPKAETIIPQRKIQTAFKKGEGLTSFININLAKEMGLDFFIEPLAVMVKRGLFLKESFILMKYVSGEAIKTIEDIDIIMDMVEKIHEKGIYHGDLNTSNFIKTADGIKIIDTQAKRENFWHFKRGYDILTMKNDRLTIELNYEVEKRYKVKRDIGYLLAYTIKNFKKLPIVEKIRGLKVKLRNKGWKI